MPRPAEKRRPGVLLDRDGVLVRLVWRAGRWVSPRQLAEFALLPGAAAAVARLRAAGLPVVVVTNQPDLARGLLEKQTLAEMHRRLAAQLGVDAIYVCPHDDADGCACRKPRPGLLLAAARDFSLNLRRSFLVGDSWKDIAAGRAVGCLTVRVASPALEAELGRADFSAAGIGAAAELILRTLCRLPRRHRIADPVANRAARRVSRNLGLNRAVP
ncbi:MAG: HAD-IIIA family hydrolase [Acidobacteriia bacterium]|nr:HAD-IIIA family hydrolase [Terriglobia bacterium]